MATDVITIVIDSAEALLAGLGGGIITIFETAIWVRSAGVDTLMNTADDTFALSGLAEWMLVFLGLGIGLSLFYAVIRKVL